MVLCCVGNGQPEMRVPAVVQLVCGPLRQGDLLGGLAGTESFCCSENNPILVISTSPLSADWAGVRGTLRDH